MQAGTRLAAIDGRLVAIDQVAAGPAAVRLRGTLLPGFVDLQVNGAGGRSVDEARAKRSTPWRARSGTAAPWRSCRP
jgi:N-acetylglucosamine-6-phosphate deacetylase